MYLLDSIKTLLVAFEERGLSYEKKDIYVEYINCVCIDNSVLHKWHCDMCLKNKFISLSNAI